MADPLHDLFERLNNPRERSVEGQFAEGRAWAHDRGRVLCYYKLTMHLEWFIFYLRTVRQLTTQKLAISESEAKLIRESCSQLLANVHAKLIERLQFRAKYSQRAALIADGLPVLARALQSVSEEDLAALTSLHAQVRDEEKNGTPVKMGGKWLPIPAPAPNWISKTRQREKAVTLTKKRSTSKSKRTKKTGKSSRNK